MAHRSNPVIECTLSFQKVYCDISTGSYRPVEILHDGPTFKPVRSIGSLRSKEAENNTGEENSDDNKEPPQKKMKNI